MLFYFSFFWPPGVTATDTDVDTDKVGLSAAMETFPGVIAAMLITQGR